jgi:hypothetical protein
MRATASVAAAMAVLTVVMTWPFGAGLATSVPGDYGDPLLVMWAIGWVSRTLTDAVTSGTVPSGFWDANIFHPEAHTLAFSEHFIGQSVLVLPVYWLTGNLILCYNVAWLATFVLSGLGTFLLVRSLVASMARSPGADRGAPAVTTARGGWRLIDGGMLAGTTAAVVFAFNEYRLVHEIAHLHVLSIHWLPFALLGFHRYVLTDSRVPLVWGAVALIGLNLSSVYYMAYAAPFVLAFVVVDVVRLGRWREPRVWFELWAAAAAVAVVMLPFLMPYMAVQQRLGVVRSLDEIVRYSATLDHYRAVLPGLVIPIALAMVALLTTRRRRLALIVPLVTLLGLSVWLSLGPVVQSGGERLDVPALYGVLQTYVPGYGGLRVPSRFAMLFFFFLALLAGVGASRLAAWTPRGAPIVVVVCLAAYLGHTRPAAFPLDEPLPSPGLRTVPAYLTPGPRLPGIYRFVQRLPSDAVLLEMPFGDHWYDLRYMFFAASHGRRLVNGYSGVFPPSFLARQQVLVRPLLDPERTAAALTGATHVIVHRAAWDDDTGSRFGAWLESHGAQIVASADAASMYEVQSAERLAALYLEKKALRETEGLRH